MDYLPEPETRADKTRANRDNARARRSTVVLEARKTSGDDHPDFDDLAALLAFEAANPDSRASGPKESRIRERFNVTAARYYQHLRYLITTNEAAAREIDPHTVNRLLRVMAA
uniref:DUF3263 domain-containing protein n=1 Tax=Leifsonia aquatica TaxID=144185 RepID=UPI000E201F93